MKNLPILLKREYWEHPAFWVTPLVILGIILLGALGGYVQGVGGTIGFNHLVSGLEVAPEGSRRGVIFLSFLALQSIFLFIMPFVVFFYLIDALYSERKQRHILFWKSLPVSDTETVISKVLTASLVIPGCFFLGMFVTKILFLLMSTLFIWFGGGSALDLLWRPAPIFTDIGFSLYSIVASGLWMLPFTGWLLLCSSLAKKSRPFMWAVLVPIFVYLVEANLFGTSRIFETVLEYLVTFFDVAFRGNGTNFNVTINGVEDLDKINMPSGFTLNQLVNPVGLVTSASLWIGLVIGSIFIAAAIYLRRYRDDS